LTDSAKLALEQLSHPSLQPEFADDIITVLVNTADKDDYSLALAYYNAVQPTLQSSEALELLYSAMARTSVMDAFYFSRTYPEPARQQLFQQLIASVLQDTANQDVSARAAELVSLPLDASEEEWFQDYLLLGDGRKFRKAKDTLMVRHVIIGKQGESFGGKGLGGQWGMVLQGLKQGMGGRTEK